MDKHNFGILVIKHEQKLYRIAKSILKNDEDCQGMMRGESSQLRRPHSPRAPLLATQSTYKNRQGSISVKSILPSLFLVTNFMNLIIKYVCPTISEF